MKATHHLQCLISDKHLPATMPTSQTTLTKASERSNKQTNTKTSPPFRLIDNGLVTLPKKPGCADSVAYFCQQLRSAQHNSTESLHRLPINAMEIFHFADIKRINSKQGKHTRCQHFLKTKRKSIRLRGKFHSRCRKWRRMRVHLAQATTTTSKKKKHEPQDRERKASCITNHEVIN